MLGSLYLIRLLWFEKKRGVMGSVALEIGG